MKCPRCNKTCKENTDGNKRYCQGHTLMKTLPLEDVDWNPEFDGLMCDYCGGDGGFTCEQNRELGKTEVCCDECFATGANRFKSLK